MFVCVSNKFSISKSFKTIFVVSSAFVRMTSMRPVADLISYLQKMYLHGNYHQPDHKLLLNSASGKMFLC